MTYPAHASVLDDVIASAQVRPEFAAISVRDGRSRQTLYRLDLQAQTAEHVPAEASADVLRDALMAYAGEQLRICHAIRMQDDSGGVYLILNEQQILLAGQWAKRPAGRRMRVVDNLA